MKWKEINIEDKEVNIDLLLSLLEDDIYYRKKVLVNGHWIHKNLDDKLKSYFDDICSAEKSYYKVYHKSNALQLLVHFGGYSYKTKQKFICKYYTQYEPQIYIAKSSDFEEYNTKAQIQKCVVYKLEPMIFNLEQIATINIQNEKIKRRINARK